MFFDITSRWIVSLIPWDFISEPYYDEAIKFVCKDLLEYYD